MSMSMNRTQSDAIKTGKKSLMRHLIVVAMLGLAAPTYAQELAQLTAAAQSNASAQMAWSEDDVSRFMDGEAAAANTRHPEDIDIPAQTTVFTTVQPTAPTVATPPISTTTITTTLAPKAQISSFSNQPSVNARAAMVMDAETGEILYTKNSQSVLPIASITKLMTAVITADARLNMDERITLQSADFSCAGCKSSSSSLRVGDSMNRAEALLFALMKSENPAAAALARTYPGGRSAFIAAMNSKAKALGMHSTHYVESTGLHPSNVSSARDLAILVSSSYQYGLIRQFSTTPNYRFNLGQRVLSSNNTNALVRNGGWNINISKTGFINEAGRCVVMHSTVNNRPVAVIILGAGNTAARNEDATRLMTWVGQIPKNI